MGLSKTLKLAKAKADKYFSEYVRRSSADKNGICQCVTCGNRLHWKRIDCGHFVTRNHESVRYDIKNGHPQCRHCNSFQSGRQYEHGKAIDRLYGDGTADKLIQKGHMLCKRNKHDYEEIAKDFKDKLSKLPT